MRPSYSRCIADAFAASIALIRASRRARAAAARRGTESARRRIAEKNDPCGATKSKWAHLQCEEFNSSAPGDEYFGRMKISYLGIDNTYKDGAISAGAYTTDPNLIAKLDFATEALQRWAAKYPNDPQLPRSYFLGVQVLRKVYTQPSKRRPGSSCRCSITKYPKPISARRSRRRSPDGFTEHWFALAQICPTPFRPA